MHSTLFTMRRKRLPRSTMVAATPSPCLLVNTRRAVSLSIPNISGALYRLLTKFAVNGLSMSKIQSKPLPTDVKHKFPDDYMFYIEFDGNVKEPVVRKLLGNFESELNYFKFHGNFRRGK